MKRILSLILAVSLLAGSCSKDTIQKPVEPPESNAPAGFSASVMQRTSDILISVQTPFISSGSVRYNFRITYTDSTRETHQVQISYGSSGGSKVVPTKKKLAWWKIIS